MNNLSTNHADQFYANFLRLEPNEQRAVVLFAETLGAQARGQSNRAIPQHDLSLAEWHKARDAATDAPDNASEKTQHMDTAQALSILLATIPAKSTNDLVAQIEWFKEEMGDFVIGNATPAHDLIFETLAKGVQNIRQ